MIRHIVFDMGNVLRRFDEDEIIGHYFENEEDKIEIKETLFSGLWAKLDKGTITYDEVKKTLNKTLSKASFEKAENLLDTWHFHMPVNPQMEKLVYGLKDNGYQIYLLSNASVRFADYKKTTAVFDCFDGFVVSAFHKTVKPEKKIYEILFNDFHLTPSECVFIDDMWQNIKTGEDFGMAGHVFTGNMEELYGFFDKIEIHYSKD